MKKGMFYGMVGFLALLATVASAPAEESHIYDAQGRYQGYSRPDPGIQGQTIYRDQNGKYQGYSTTTPSGETVYRDRDGKYVGRETGCQPNDQKK